jgi:hypothetical protein
MNTDEIEIIHPYGKPPLPAPRSFLSRENAGQVNKTEVEPESVHFKIALIRGNIVIGFGRPIEALGLGAAQARALAHSLRQLADQIDRAGRERYKSRRQL